MPNRKTERMKAIPHPFTPTPRHKETPQVSSQSLPYRLRDCFLSSAEIDFFRILHDIVGERFIICPKVALVDVFNVARPNENVHFYNKIFRKHVDFLLCSSQTLKPIMGVELVRPGIKSEIRSGDQFMEDLFMAAGLPLVHIPLADHYDINDIVPLFGIAVSKVKDRAFIPPSASSDSVPLCPKCGTMMVLRVHRTGPMIGQKYYSCMNFPQCPGMLPIAAKA